MRRNPERGKTSAGEFSSAAGAPDEPSTRSWSWNGEMGKLTRDAPTSTASEVAAPGLKYVSRLLTKLTDREPRAAGRGVHSTDGNLLTHRTRDGPRRLHSSVLGPEA